MGVAKASLIVVGTAVGLGGVLAYQPPHHTLGLGGGLKGLGGGTTENVACSDRPASPTATPQLHAQMPAYRSFSLPRQSPA